MSLVLLEHLYLALGVSFMLIGGEEFSEHSELWNTINHFLQHLVAFSTTDSDHTWARVLLTPAQSIASMALSFLNSKSHTARV